jgi:hypothetical protein
MSAVYFVGLFFDSEDKVAYYSETSVVFKQAALRYTQENTTLVLKRCNRPYVTNIVSVR